MEVQTAIHIQPEKYTGPRIQKGETSGQTQRAAPVSLRPEISSGEEEKENTGNSTTLARLTPAQMHMLSELKSRDQEVRTHEQAHVAAGGGHVSGGIRYNYQKGPDGRMYAIGGEVSIDVSPVPGDPEATAKKMEQVRRAAMAPMDPSPQDRSVAARAVMIRSDALQEITLMQMEQGQSQAAHKGGSEEKPYGHTQSDTGNLFSIQV